MYKKLSTVLGAILLFSTTADLAGAGSSVASIERLIATADMIVVAGIIQGTAVDGPVSASLGVEEVIKGTAQAGDTITVIWNEPPFASSRRELQKGGRGLFFLERPPGGGPWRILPATKGFAIFEMTYYYLPAGQRPAEFRPAPASTVADRVFLPLAWATAAGHPGSLMRGIQRDLEPDFTGALRSPAVREVFRRFASSNTPRLRSMGLRSSLRDGEITSLVSFESGQRDLQGTAYWEQLVERLRFDFTNPDPAAVAILGRLTTSAENAGLRTAGASALARIHTRAALPHLARLLDQPELTLKTLGVGGLAMFANNVPIGSHHPAPGDWSYRTDETIAHSAMSESVISAREAYYVGFWKNWWLQNRDKLGLTP